MSRMRNELVRAAAKLRSELGQDLAEYGLLLLLIAIAAIVGVNAVGNADTGLWAQILAAWPAP
jgi:Flp pilus assembly pilin Flp